MISEGLETWKSWHVITAQREGKRHYLGAKFGVTGWRDGQPYNMNTSEIEKIAPDYWRNSHLSIAKYYGGCIINGVRYMLDKTDYLVREDIWKKEKLAEGKKKTERKKQLQEAQLPLTPLKKTGYR